MKTGLSATEIGIGTKLARTVREQIKAMLPFGIELGTVTSAPPNIRIRLDHMTVDLEAEDLIICEHLLRHERIVTLEHTTGTPRQLGDKSALSSASANGQYTPASYPPPFAASVNILDFDFSYVKQTFEDVLKPGDRVAVMAFPNEQKYLVWDRVVELDG